MRLGRLFALSMVGALALHAAQPAFARDIRGSGDLPIADDPDDSSPAEQSEPQGAPTRKAAPKTPRHTAPAKPAAAKPAPAAPAAAETTPSGKPPITAQEVRPPASMMIECPKAPSPAVTKLPDDLAKWAVVYCTKLGHIFNADDRHFGAFPDTGLRASFSAADLSGKTGEPGNDAYFTKIDYHQLTPTERDALIALDPTVKRIFVDKPLWRLDLAAVGGSTLSFLAIDPSADPFWVFPLGQKGIDKPAFYVTSLEALNRAR